MKREYSSHGVWVERYYPVDEYGNPVERTKQSHPYSYDGFVTWRGGENNEANGTIYSDRLLQWDYAKYNKLSKVHFGNEGQYWNSRNPEAIEKFLREWTGEKKLRLILVMEYCNVSNGYPVWRFDYYMPSNEPDVQVSDTTVDAQRTEAGKINNP